MNLGGAWRWARRRLRDVATIGGAVVDALGIKSKTVVGKVVEGARKGDAVVTAAEGAIGGEPPDQKPLDRQADD